MKISEKAIELLNGKIESIEADLKKKLPESEVVGITVMAVVTATDGKGNGMDIRIGQIVDNKGQSAYVRINRPTPTEQQLKR
jgi:hypothetical protein